MLIIERFGGEEKTGLGRFLHRRAVESAELGNRCSFLCISAVSCG